MFIFPAIDLYGQKAVRLYKGNYDEMTVYSENPIEIAYDFEKAGARFAHIVDLEGAKNGETPNFEVIKGIADKTNLFIEVGGGIRSMDTVEKYLGAGVDRVILGTAAVTDEEFLRKAVGRYGSKIAVGADIKDGYVAIKGWLEKSEYILDTFCEKMQDIGVEYMICTDISKDGAMIGTNRDMYRALKNKYNINITASGGVSSKEDIEALSKLDIYGAIIGKAYYTNAIDLKEALMLARP